MAKVRDFMGPYRLARLIRVGNTCSVWEAIKDGEKDRYALKVLRQDVPNPKEEIAHLKHEFEVAHGIKHPFIIRILEFNMQGSTAYLVLELYSEHNMKQALRSGTDRYAFYVPKIVEQASEALYYLNEQGWVHCDIKPDNLLVSSEGDVKLIDFTIAQRIRKGLGRLFGGGRKTIRGTRSYMSPEQIRGKPLDARSDVYGFGCVLFELLAGRPPYTGTTPDELLEKHLRASPPSVQVYNANVTQEVSLLIRRMMAKEVNERPETMWEFLKEFRSYRLFKKSPKKPESLVVKEIAPDLHMD